MKKIILIFAVLFSTYLQSQTTLTRGRIDTIWGTGQVPKGVNNTNTWFTLHNRTNIAITPTSVVTPTVTVVSGTFTTVATSTLTTNFITTTSSHVNLSNKPLLNVNALSVNSAEARVGYKFDVHGNAAIGQKTLSSIYLGSGDAQISFVTASDSSGNRKNLRISAKTVNVYSDNALADTIVSAQLAVSSITRGFLPPRMTTTQRDAIVSPVNGLMIYNSTTGLYNGYQSGAWAVVGANFFTDAGAYTYLTSTTDNLVLGGTTSLGAYKLGVNGSVYSLNSTLGFLHEKAASSYFFAEGFSGNNPFITHYGADNLIIGYGTGTGGAPNVNTLTLKNSGAVDVFGLLTGKSGFSSYYDASNFANFAVQADGRMAFDATGANASFTFADKVGVGITTTPSAMLEVRGTGATSGTYNQRNYNSSNTLLYELNDAGSSTFNGQINSGATQTSVNNSTSGTTTFSQPFGGVSYKKVIVYCNAALGTASYTFPIAFTNTPMIITSNQVGAAVITTLNTTTMIITGATTTGFITIEGY